jgi:hypothetical protein
MAGKKTIVVTGATGAQGGGLARAILDDPKGPFRVRALTWALGETVRYNDVPPQVYRGLGFPGAEDLGNMFQFKRDFNEYFCGIRNLDESRALNPSLQTFDHWLARNRDHIPLG